MFSRYFLTFCAFMLIATFAIASAEEVVEDVDESLSEEDLTSSEIMERSKIGRKIEKLLKKAFKHVNDHCIKKALKKCKKHWYNPSKALSCAKDFVTGLGTLCLIE